MYLVGCATGDCGCCSSCVPSLTSQVCHSATEPSEPLFLWDPPTPHRPHQDHHSALCQPRGSIGQCELLQPPAGQSRPVRHNPACWPAAPFFAHPNRIIRDLHHRKLLDEPSPIDRNHHLRHDPSQAESALTVTGTPSRSHGVQNRYACFLHHRSPPAERARPEAGDQAKPRAYGALRQGRRCSRGNGDTCIAPDYRCCSSPRVGHELTQTA